MNRWLKPVVARSPTESNRTATPLELFFDLVFVVSVNFAATTLHHDLSHGFIRQGVLFFIPAFFVIWLAWLNFTWFASAYDADDAVYRLLVLVQMTGALVLAAGIPRDVGEQTSLRTIAAGYVIMRLALVVQWLRVAYWDPAHRSTALRYAVGRSAVQVGWAWFGFVYGHFSWPIFIGLGLADVLVPIWAERAGPTTWHPHHIVERYGLFTIIVLGEAVLASSLAIQTIVGNHSFGRDMVIIVIGAILILYAMWWIYFDYPAPVILDRLHATFLWSYGHLVLWGSIAATGAGIAICIDFASRRADLTQLQAHLALSVPVALFLMSLWAFHDLGKPVRSLHRAAVPVAALIVIACAWLPLAPLWVGSTLVALTFVRERRAPHRHVRSAVAP